jgi:hypothetical protein
LWQTGKIQFLYCIAGWLHQLANSGVIVYVTFFQETVVETKPVEPKKVELKKVQSKK